jgi:hypothetical protein
MAHDHADIALKGETASKLLKQLGRRDAARLRLDFGQESTVKKRREAKAGKKKPGNEPVSDKAETSVLASRNRRLWYLVRGKRGDSEEIQAVIEAAVAAARRAGPTLALKLLSQKTEALPTEPIEPLEPAISDYKKHEAERWATTRETFLAEHPSVTAPELAELTGSKAKNPSSRAHSWSKAGRIFSVSDGASERFPLFQIQEDKPLSQIAEILSILRPRLSNWQIALWLTTPNAWVGEWRTPISLLAKQPDVVIEAARHEVAEKVF